MGLDKKWSLKNKLHFQRLIGALRYAFFNDEIIEKE